MSYRIRVIQRVGIDMDDDHGEHAGDGAALIDLAVLQLDLEFPFVPYPGLVLLHRGARVEFFEVSWNHLDKCFVCEGDPVWRQTRTGAEGIVASLISGGFCLTDSDHQTADIH